MIGTDIIDVWPGLVASEDKFWCDNDIFDPDIGGVAIGIGYDVGGWYVLGGNGGKL